MAKKGFFAAASLPTVTHAPVASAPQCGLCGLHKQCLSPKMPVWGKGGKGILVVGDSPDRFADASGRPFSGQALDYLSETLASHGVDMRRDCWSMNALSCHPDKGTKLDGAVSHCRPLVVNAIKERKPSVILLLGARAMHSVLGWLWKSDIGTEDRWVGWRIPVRRINALVCPTWIPAHDKPPYLIGDQGKKNSDVARVLFSTHVENAVKHAGRRPYSESEEYVPPLKQVQLIYDPVEMAHHLHDMREAGLPVAIDYESDRLKPDHEDAQIVCCAVSNGALTFAYPWHGEAVEATKELLLDGNVGKISHNAKHEARWTRRVLGVRVRNWKWDSMLAAHVLDNRKGVTGLKFQAFAVLGEESYDDAIKPYLSADGGNAKNRIRELDLAAVMRYCGADTLLTWRLAMRQMEQLGANTA